MRFSWKKITNKGDNAGTKQHSKLVTIVPLCRTNRYKLTYGELSYPISVIADPAKRALFLSSWWAGISLAFNYSISLSWEAIKNKHIFKERCWFSGIKWQLVFTTCQYGIEAITCCNGTQGHKGANQCSNHNNLLTLLVLRHSSSSGTVAPYRPLLDNSLW